MMVETMSDVIAIFCYARQTFKSFGQIDYIILLTIWRNVKIALQ